MDLIMSTSSRNGALAVAAAAALSLGATLAFDRPILRLVLAVVAAAVLALPLVPRWKNRLSRSAQTYLLAAVAAAVLTHAVAEDLWRYSSTPWVRVWNVYHYYLGAEYFEELGFHDLYDATLAADRQESDYWRKVRRVRNLSTYEVEAREVGESRYDPSQHFTPERWEAFRQDVVALQKQMPPRSWRGVFTDRGYNPPPFWTFLGQRLTRLLPARSIAALKILTVLDLLLLGLTFALIRRVFGLHKALLVLIFLTLSPVNTGRFIGGFLQYDWFCAIAAGVCWLRQRKPIPAAAALAYATMTRVFPVILVGSLVLSVLAFWIRSGRIRRRDLKFGLAFGLFCLLALGLGSLTGRGPDAWLEFASNISHHSQEHTFGQRRVGLKHVFTHDLASFEFDEGVRQRRRTLARQQTAYQAAAALGLIAFGLALMRRRDRQALLLGLIPLFLLTVSSRYYWSCLALLPLAGLGLGRRQRRTLNLAQGLLFAAYYLFAFFRPDRYGAYSVLNLLLILFLGLVLTYELRRQWRAHDRLAKRNARPFFERRAVWLAFFGGLFVVLCLLRLPLTDRPIRDVDESVSAIIATTWLEGGIPYRDAIDQRGPVTYALYAMAFLASGPNDMTAVHWMLLLLILVSTGVVFALGRRLLPGPQGAALAFSAAALLAVGTYTYRRSQMLAFHTEWPGMLASTVGMLLLWTALGQGRKPRRNLVLAGICFGLAFLSKQPAIFDGGAAGLFLLLHAAFNRRLLTKETFLRAALLASGFFATVLAAVAYFATAGALWDFYYYYWKYNVDHYTAVVPMADRLQSLNPFAHRRHYLTANPLLFAGSMLSAAVALYGLLRRRFQVEPAVWGRLLLVLWLVFSYFGASYSGRNFGHYFIQIIPPLCLLTAWLLVDLWNWQRVQVWVRPRRLAFRMVLLCLVAMGLFYSLHRFRRDMALFGLTEPARPRVAQDALLKYIREASDPQETLFVWGYNPEIYMLAPRRSATRYSNTNYLTGMLPWENHQKGIDTSEHIVPGSWDLLLEELEENRPALIVDTVPGNHRYYRKYPIEAFPRLRHYLDRGYRRTARILDRKGRPYYDVYRRLGDS